MTQLSATQIYFVDNSATVSTGLGSLRGRRIACKDNTFAGEAGALVMLRIDPASSTEFYTMYGDCELAKVKDNEFKEDARLRFRPRDGTYTLNHIIHKGNEHYNQPVRIEPSTSNVATINKFEAENNHYKNAGMGYIYEVEDVNLLNYLVKNDEHANGFHQSIFYAAPRNGDIELTGKAAFVDQPAELYSLAQLDDAGTGNSLTGTAKLINSPYSTEFVEVTSGTNNLSEEFDRTATEDLGVSPTSAPTGIYPEGTVVRNSNADNNETWQLVGGTWVQIA